MRRLLSLRTGVIVLLLAAAGGGIAWWRARPATPAGASDTDRVHTVTRGDFEVTVVQNGSLDAIKRHDLKPGGSGRQALEVNWVIEDKTPVEEGDAIVRFSPEKFRETEEQLLLDIEEEEKDLVLARQDLRMRRAANLSSIRGAVDALRNAREALEKYVDLDAPNRRKQLDRALADAEAALADAREEHKEAADALWEAGWEDEDEREALRETAEAKESAVRQAERALEKARQNLRAFRQYDHPQKLRSLREGVASAELDFRKAVADAEGNIVKEEQRIRNTENRLRQLRTDLERLQEDMKQLELTAPVAGIVNLGAPETGRRWNQPKEIKVGAEVRPNETVAYIPDLSKFLVRVDIPEEYRSLIEEGLPARVRTAAIPDLLLEGAVSEIAPMPSHTIWWDKNSPKVYATEIATEETHPDLMPGLTMEVEIVVKTVEDVLHVPVEAVYNREGQAYCRVRTPAGWTERPVTAGEASLHHLEITDGLSEGDRVLLYRPEDEEPAP